MGKRSRTKGAVGEREAARLLSRVTGRSWQRTAGQYRSGGDLPDIEPDGWQPETPLWVEVKRGKRTSPKAALAQAIDACAGHVPVALTRDDRGEWLITFELSHFVRVVAGLLGPAFVDATGVMVLPPTCVREEVAVRAAALAAGLAEKRGEAEKESER